MVVRRATPSRDTSRARARRPGTIVRHPRPTATQCDAAGIMLLAITANPRGSPSPTARGGRKPRLAQPVWRRRWFEDHLPGAGRFSCRLLLLSTNRRHHAQASPSPNGLGGRAPGPVLTHCGVKSFRCCCRILQPPRFRSRMQKLRRALVRPGARTQPLARRRPLSPW
jgi:hypothetical protein